MRRILILTVAAGALLVGCSSSSDSQEVSSSSTTTSTVLVSPENKTICADLEQIREQLATARAAQGASPEEQKTEAVALFTALAPLLEQAKASAPSDLIKTLDDYSAAIAPVVGADPADPEAEARLAVLIIGGDPVLVQAQTSLQSWATVNCGIDLDS